VGSLPPCKGGEIEEAIMTVRDGSRIHGWWNQFHRTIEENGHGTHTDFSTMERSSEKNSELRSKLNCEDVSGGVKGRDERKERALDPPLTPTLFCALTQANVVIHRMTNQYLI
jgi:hypothetical protein